MYTSTLSLAVASHSPLHLWLLHNLCSHLMLNPDSSAPPDLPPCRVPSAGFFSHVLHWVRHERADREKEFRRQQLEAKRQQRQEKENSIVDWEQRLLQGQAGLWLKAMWEVSMHLKGCIGDWCVLVGFEVVCVHVCGEEWRIGGIIKCGLVGILALREQTAINGAQ